MKKSRYTEEQVAYALRLAESGTPVADVCRQTGIAEATFYLWKKKFGSLGRARGPRVAADARGECAVEATRGRSDARQADPPGGDPKKVLRPARRRELAQWVQDRYQVSCRRACALARICPNTWYYQITGARAAALRMRIREIAQARPRFGYVRIWIMLRREGWPDNKKRIHRLYRLEGLQVRMRARRKKRLSLHRGVVPPASGRDQAWSMDFVHDQLVTGRAFRVLDRHRSVESRECADGGQRRPDRPERRRRARGARRPVGRCRRPSRSITAPNSRPRRWTNGPTDAGSPWISFGPESPWRTPLSRVSTAACVMSASTCTASNPSRTPRRSSTRGVTITITVGPIRLTGKRTQSPRRHLKRRARTSRALRRSRYRRLVKSTEILHHLNRDSHFVGLSTQRRRW